MTRLGERELDILQVLWERGTATAGEVHEALVAAGEHLAYTTVLTMLQRMTAKDLVDRDTSGRAHVYRAVVAAPSAASNAVERVIDRFFGGDPAALATHLVAGGLRKRDLDRLQELIDARRARSKR